VADRGRAQHSVGLPTAGHLDFPGDGVGPAPADPHPGGRQRDRALSRPRPSPDDEREAPSRFGVGKMARLCEFSGLTLAIHGPARAGPMHDTTRTPDRRWPRAAAAALLLAGAAVTAGLVLAGLRHAPPDSQS